MVNWHRMTASLYLGLIPALLAGEVDIVLNFVGPLLVRLDAGDPLVILAGGHVGCFELFGTEHVRAIRDLKGKTLAIPRLSLLP
jgi:NitT/TauT family transport system substrate-binding protein